MKIKYLRKIRKGYRYSFNDDGTVDVVDRETLKHKVYEHVMDFMFHWLQQNSSNYILRKWFYRKGEIIDLNLGKALKQFVENFKLANPQ